MVWHGMKIDAELRIWQRKEEPISILKVLYQNLKPLILKAAGRSRNRAEWHIGVSSERGRAPLEIDNEVSHIVATFERKKYLAFLSPQYRDHAEEPDAEQAQGARFRDIVTRVVRVGIDVGLFVIDADADRIEVNPFET